ncbi:MAG: HypC/HybG/HupF family hydrogenase formation chaperone [Burkholderiales bacterium]|nr:HypC/HybG/HupF family hydrogenase formation chaperone [Burkholderiales bacterium]
MCVGIPMQVMEAGKAGEIAAPVWCEARDGGRREQISMLLIGDQPPGTWLLTFQGSALRVMSPEEAAQTSDALLALAQTMNGDTSQLDTLFADLVNREPSLPPHLQAELAAVKNENVQNVRENARKENA